MRYAARIPANALMALMALVLLSPSSVADTTAPPAEKTKSLSDYIGMASAEIAELKRIGGEGFPTYKAATEFYRKMDQTVKNVIWATFKEKGSFEEVQNSTPEFVTWYEWPHDYSTYKGPLVTGRNDAPLSDEEWRAMKNSVYVFYRRFHTESGTDIFCFQNTFWNARPSKSYRICPSMYTIIVSSDVKLVDLYVLYDNITEFDALGGPENPFFLGFVDQEDAMPKIVTILGPGGRQQVIDVNLYTYNKENVKWERERLILAPTAGRFSYDEQSTVLTFEQRFSDPAGSWNPIYKEVIFSVRDCINGKTEKILAF